MFQTLEVGCKRHEA